MVASVGSPEKGVQAPPLQKTQGSAVRPYSRVPIHEAEQQDVVSQMEITQAARKNHGSGGEFQQVLGEFPAAPLNGG